jgi:hypothetical protein
MARPRRDGTPARAPNRRRLTALFVQKLKAPERPTLIWDQLQRGLVLSVRPSGRAAFKVVYGRLGRVRWYHLGDKSLGLKAARELARRIMYQVAEGKDPQAERKAQRSSGTFEDLASRYVEEYAKKNNKSWSQADALVHKHLLPKWGKLRAADIVRGDVKAMMARIEAQRLAQGGRGHE